MNNDPTPTTPQIIATPTLMGGFPALCWSAILGGTVAAMGIQVLLSILGAGAGLAIFAPMSDPHATRHFSEGAAFIWSLCALVALFFGAVIAGRFSRSLHGGFVHGILVWCLSLLITLAMLSVGTGMMLGGTLKVFGESIGVGGKVAAVGVGELVKEGARQNADRLKSFTLEAVQSVPTNAAPKANTRAEREIGFAIAKFFAAGNDYNAESNRVAVIRALTEYAQLNEADAVRMVNDWTASYKSFQAEWERVKSAAELKARAAADEAAHDLAVVAGWAFFGLLLGLLVSAAGGVLGADHALRRAKVVAVPAAPVPIS